MNLVDVQRAKSHRWTKNDIWKNIMAYYTPHKSTDKIIPYYYGIYYILHTYNILYCTSDVQNIIQSKVHTKIKNGTNIVYLCTASKLFAYWAISCEAIMLLLIDITFLCTLFRYLINFKGAVKCILLLLFLLLLL